MTERTHQDWRELCVAVATENDPTKLSSLIQELIEALDNAHTTSANGTVDRES
jgi:hypothetical protein